MLHVHILTVVVVAAGVWTAVVTPQARAYGLRDEYVVDAASGIEATPIRAAEGVAFDPLGGDFYATAVFGGRITRIDGRSGVETTFYQDVEFPGRSFIGMKISALRRVAWVCGVDYADPSAPVSHVYALRVTWSGRGQLLRRIALPSPFFCNDLALDAAGNVFVTDSFGSALMRIDARAAWDASADAEVFVQSALLAPSLNPDGTPAFGMNGIAVTPNNRYLIVAMPGRLLRISLARATDIRPLSFTGDAFATHPDPDGDPARFLTPDGIIFAGSKLYVVFLGAIQQLTFSDDRYLEAEVATTTEAPLGLSTATNAYGAVYAIDSEIHAVVPGLTLPVEPSHRIIRVEPELF